MDEQTEDLFEEKKTLEICLKKFLTQKKYPTYYF